MSRASEILRKINESPKFKVGDRVRMTSDALDTYGSQYANKVFKIDSVARNHSEHPGYDDAAAGQGLYDLSLNGSSFGNSLYDYELQRESKANEDYTPNSDVASIKAKNPNRTVWDVGTMVKHKPTGLGVPDDCEGIGKVMKVEDHGAGMIAHFVLWPGKRKPTMSWGSWLEKA
jgi:hypothetical protein